MSRNSCITKNKTHTNVITIPPMRVFTHFFFFYLRPQFWQPPNPALSTGCRWNPNRLSSGMFRYQNRYRKYVYSTGRFLPPPVAVFVAYWHNPKTHQCLRTDSFGPCAPERVEQLKGGRCPTEHSCVAVARRRIIF